MYLTHFWGVFKAAPKAKKVKEAKKGKEEKKEEPQADDQEVLAENGEAKSEEVYSSLFSEKYLK